MVDGPELDGPTVSRLFCDSAVHRVVMAVMAGRSSILDYGTATSTIPAPLWNALVIRVLPPPPPPPPTGLARHAPPDCTFEVTAPDGEVRATSPPRAECPW